MLLDEIYALPKGKYILPGDLDVATVLAGTRQRAKSAQPMILDEDAVAMAVNVWMSKPSSILTALNWVNLPFETTWIEFDNLDMRQAIIDAGAHKLESSKGDANFHRTGFLLWRQNNIIVADMVQSVTPAGTQGIEPAPNLCMARLFFDPQPDEPGKKQSRTRATKSEARAKVDLDLGEHIVGKLRDYLTLRKVDPVEADAYQRLRGMFDFEAHEDYEPLINHQFYLGQAIPTSRVIAGMLQDIKRFFEMLILPTLILLNCKNAVDMEKRSFPNKINQHRIKKGKFPLLDHYIVKMHLNPRWKQQILSAGTETGNRPSRATIVASHFKVRKTGVFLWRSYKRGSGAYVPKTIIVTP